MGIGSLDGSSEIFYVLLLRTLDTSHVQQTLA